MAKKRKKYPLEFKNKRPQSLAALRLLHVP